MWDCDHKPINTYSVPVQMVSPSGPSQTGPNLWLSIPFDSGTILLDPTGAQPPTVLLPLGEPSSSPQSKNPGPLGPLPSGPRTDRLTEAFGLVTPPIGTPYQPSDEPSRLPDSSEGC